MGECMSANVFGTHFSMMSFGESHGPAMGVVIDGCPAGVEYKESFLLEALERRRPGQSQTVSARNEPDRPHILSGIFEGKTLGTPIAIIIHNTDQRSQDYQGMSRTARVGHADDVWFEKFQHSDPRGGGRASGRETVSRVLAGAFARMFCEQVNANIKVTGEVEKIHTYQWSDERVNSLLLDAKEKGLSYGGVARLKISGLPLGLGQPVFRKFKADLTTALMSVGATSGVELGAGFEASQAEGSQFHSHDTHEPQSTRYGGVRGGITTGEDVEVRLHFKPTASVMDVAKKGRHDPCIVPRAVPVIEAMTYLVIADHILWRRLDRV